MWNKPVKSAASGLMFSGKVPVYEKCVFAGGCFWGVQYYFHQLDGVVDTKVGYIGGHMDHPTYQQVCTGATNHAEGVQVEYDPEKVSFQKIAKTFFEIHDPTQVNRQGVDIGTQYRSHIFYTTQQQRQVAQLLIQTLKDKGINVATQLSEASTFWEAEDYHQHYFQKQDSLPTCHVYKKVFDD